MTPAATAFWRSPFWRRWVWANALGEAFGLGTVAGAGWLLFRHAGEPTGVAQTLGFAAVFVGLGAFEGLVLGLAQRHVLRQRLPSIRGWVRATVVGAMVAWAVGMAPNTIAQLVQPGGSAVSVATEPPLAVVLLLAAGLGAVAGPLLAAFQWLSLRRVLPGRAWQWLPANALAWALGMPVIFVGTQTDRFTSHPAAIAAGVVLCLFAAGAVVGAVHGLVLLHLAAGSHGDINGR